MIFNKNDQTNTLFTFSALEKNEKYFLTRLDYYKKTYTINKEKPDFFLKYFIGKEILPLKKNSILHMIFLNPNKY